MPARLDDAALDQLFLSARSRNAWKSDPVPESMLHELYDLLRLGPTAANTSPARFVFVTSEEAKEKLASVSSGNNQAKIKAAPATVIIGYDLDFPETMPKLFPHFRNSSLQGAYLIIAARSLGLDCGPMSGFDNGKVDALFFAGTKIKSNFICSIGYGADDNLFPRLPRHSFDEACKIV
jgi:3-hydroxypropanoate dehydrogenase